MITYRVNVAAEQIIAEHLLQCDSRFLPPLSSRLNIHDYAKKIHVHADRFEAWYGDQLIALVALYCNDQQSRIAFVTSVSVYLRWEGNGIASKLVQQCIDHARRSNMKQIQLEVAEGNHAAQSLYRRHGFETASCEQSAVTMRLTLQG